MPSTPRGLFLGEPGEVAELHELGLDRVLGFELRQGLVEGQEVLGGGRGRDVDVVEVLAAPAGRRASRPACGGRCRRGCGAWPRPPRRRNGRGYPTARVLFAIDEPEVGLVDQGRGLERLPRLLLGEPLLGEPPELARRRAAGAPRPPGGRPARWPRGCGSRRSSTNSREKLAPLERRCSFPLAGRHRHGLEVPSPDYPPPSESNRSPHGPLTRGQGGRPVVADLLTWWAIRSRNATSTTHAEATHRPPEIAHEAGFFSVFCDVPVSGLVSAKANRGRVCRPIANLTPALSRVGEMCIGSVLVLRRERNRCLIRLCRVTCSGTNGPVCRESSLPYPTPRPDAHFSERAQNS